jgi:hypothetical protein
MMAADPNGYCRRGRPSSVPELPGLVVPVLTLP